MTYLLNRLVLLTFYIARVSGVAVSIYVTPPADSDEHKTKVGIRFWRDKSIAGIIFTRQDYEVIDVAEYKTNA